MPVAEKRKRIGTVVDLDLAGGRRIAAAVVSFQPSPAPKLALPFELPKARGVEVVA